MRSHIAAIRFLAGAAFAALCLLAAAPPALAQAVVASVNDDPVTNVDIEQHLRILRVMRRPATSEAALEDIYETRLKLIETSKFKITPSDADIGWALGFTARPLKMEVQQFLVALQRAGVTEDQWKQKWKAEAAWLQYIRALNRTLEVSETEVRGELSKQGKTQSLEYTVRQVILVVPIGAGPAVVSGRMQDAQQLRAKFTDCTAGADLVRATRDAVLNPPVTRSASSLGEPLRVLLSKTDVGHLTTPSRGQQGVEMLAVCGKAEREDGAAAEAIRGDLLMKRLEAQSQRRYAEVRAKAVIVRK